MMQMSHTVRILLRNLTLKEAELSSEPSDMRERLEADLLNHFVSDEDVELGIKAIVRHQPGIAQEELERQCEVFVAWLYEVEMAAYLRDMLRREVIDGLYVPADADPRDVQFVFNSEFAKKAEDHLDAMRRAIASATN